ncbi:uncharacterized protein LOC129959329 [Argiope bruennichi]|uniref:uncharacterized protein LOC129959329 n=1 Tax=Argiope bruennichi TaxID=94029 RepID=UPI0024945CD2|nr:uncharacterized protein LOC129959329 [Argiope bruennichi]
MSITKFKKEELKAIAEELKLPIPDNAKVLDLRELIQESKIYKTDKESYQTIVDCVLQEINERKDKLEREKLENENRLEFERIKLSQLERELEIAKLREQSREMFGYVASGSVDEEVNNKIHCGLIRDSDLNTTLKTFWELESIGVKDEGITSEEDMNLELFKENICFKNGRYEVGLPWKRDSNELSDNFDLAKRRLSSLMRKMQNDKVLYSEYCKVLKGYLDEGIIERVTNPFASTNNPVFYLPHQVIIKNESLTTKLRIVFDASAHEIGQLSLNDCLHQGVNLNPNIFDLLISFRLNKIAILADMEKAFLQISLTPKDKDAVRFLVANSENDVQVYRFNRVLFGVNSSPILLAATIKTHIEKYKEQYPVTVRRLDNCFYVDDLVAGEDDVSSAFDLSNTAAKIMDDAGMNLRKWISNDCDLIKQWQTEHFDHLNINDFVNQPHRVLGLSWSPQNDYVSLNLKGLLDFLLKRKNTKRFLLMAAGRIFDPMGFVSPFTIRFKILFQEIWQSKTDWDEELLPDVNENIKAYGAVSDLRLKTPNKICVYLLDSKCRVAPLKPLSLPRLELMGALLAARLAKEVSRVLSEKIPATNHFWTDSTIALSWIQGSSSRWKVFVANRVKEIQSLTNKDTWHHCPGKNNPSNLLTRGISADSLLNREKWWNGPSFLHEENIVPKNDDVILSDDSVCQEELKSFVDNCKQPFNKQIGPLKISEVQRAETTLVKLVQQVEFESELKDLSTKGMVSPQNNASNFVGTQLELKRLRKILSNSNNNMSKFLCDERVEWSFIPPRAPNHRGLWEAGVKAVKYHIKRIMGNLKFTYEEFLTILNQIEGILNSRPLYPLSCDPNDFDVLTPGHFLVGRPISAIVEPSLTELPDNRLKQSANMVNCS